MIAFFYANGYRPLQLPLMLSTFNTEETDVENEGEIMGCESGKKSGGCYYWKIDVIKADMCLISPVLVMTSIINKDKNN